MKRNSKGREHYSILFFLGLLLPLWGCQTTNSPQDLLKEEKKIPPAFFREAEPGAGEKPSFYYTFGENLLRSEKEELELPVLAVSFWSFPPLQKKKPAEPAPLQVLLPGMPALKEVKKPEIGEQKEPPAEEVKAPAGQEALARKSAKKREEKPVPQKSLQEKPVKPRSQKPEKPRASVRTTRPVSPPSRKEIISVSGLKNQPIRLFFPEKHRRYLGYSGGDDSPGEGLAGEPRSGNPVLLKRKVPYKKGILFEFLFLKKGTYLLSFRGGRGEQILRKVYIRGASDDIDFSRVGLSPDLINLIENLLKEKLYTLLISNLENRTPVPYTNDRLGEAYYRTKQFRKAFTLWQRNLRRSPPWRQRAFKGVLKSILEINNHKEFMKLYELYRREFTPDRALRTELIAVAERKSDIYTRLKLYEDFLKAFPGDEREPEYFYKAAELFRRESPYRDLRKARMLYKNILDRYPLSPYYVPASQNLDALEKKYFDLR